MATHTPGTGAGQGGRGPQGAPNLRARAQAPTSQPPCMPFQSPPRVASNSRSFSQATAGSATHDAGGGDAMPQFLVEQQAGGHVVMRGAGPPAPGARLTFFDRIDALKELRALREAEVLETHTLAHAIMVRGPPPLSCGPATL